MANRAFYPDLSEHFILIHPARQTGIIEFRNKKTECRVAYYRVDEDGDLHIGRREWVKLDNLPKGKGFIRINHVHYLHDFVDAPNHV